MAVLGGLGAKVVGLGSDQGEKWPKPEEKWPKLERDLVKRQEA